MQEREKLIEAAPARDASCLWHKPLPASVEGRDVCLFVSYAASGELKPHVATYLAALRQEGFLVLAIAAMETDLAAPAGKAAWCAAADAFVARQNAGYDFGAWAAILNTEPRLWQAASLTLANDSVFGPFDGFREVMNRIRRSRADVVALVETLQRKRHFQSFFMTFKNEALRSNEMKKFWNAVRNLKEKSDVITRYELELTTVCERANLTLEILFPLDAVAPRLPRNIARLNPTHHLWRQLIDAGFPFIKIELLRDNPAAVNLNGWQQKLATHGADIAAMEHLLETVWRKRGYGARPYNRWKVVKDVLKKIRRTIRKALGIPDKRTRRARKRTLISSDYLEQNMLLHETGRFGRYGDKWADKVNELLATGAYESILDYGCGQGSLAKALDVPVREYDPAIPGKETLPEPADLVICTDVLEHIEPEYLENVLDHLRDLTRKTLFAVIATRPAAKTLSDGRNAHLIVQPETWWRAQMERRFNVREWEVSEGEVSALLGAKK